MATWVQSNPAVCNSRGIASPRLPAACGLCLTSRAKAVVCGHVSADIDQVQSAAGTQHSKDLRCRRRFRIRVQVMQHHRRQHPVEFGVGVAEPLCVAVFEANPVKPVRLSLRAMQCQRVGVGSDHLYQGLRTLRPDGEITGPAADFQHTMAVGEFGLGDQLLMHTVEAEQAGQ